MNRLNNVRIELKNIKNDFNLSNTEISNESVNYTTISKFLNDNRNISILKLINICNQLLKYSVCAKRCENLIEMYLNDDKLSEIKSIRVIINEK
ncbi:hypothetical protein ACV3TL_13650 [Clostridium perfringens]|nr:hypothetical protein [Clostridium perfringens]